MSNRGAPFVLAAGALAAFAAFAPQSRADGKPVPEASAPAAAVDEATAARRVALLARVAAATPDAADRTATELGASAAWADLFASYVEVMGDFRNPHRAELVLDALARCGPAKIHEFLAASAAKDADPLLRTVALRVAGRPRTDAALADVLALALSFPEEERASHVLLAPLAAAVGAVVERRPAEAEVLRTRWKSFEPRFRTAFLDALESSAGAGATGAVSRLLDTGAPGDGEILLRLARMPVRDAHPYDPRTESYAVASLTAADADLRAGAAAFCGRVGGPEVAEQLLGMLGDEDPRVAAVAHRALEAATGSALVADRELWRSRLGAEREWAGKDLAADLESARGAASAIVVSAIQRLSQHRLHGAAIAPSLEALADHDDASVRAAICAALGRLGQPSSIRALLDACEDPETAVASAASASLALVTRLPAPAEPADWRRSLGSSGR